MSSIFTIYILKKIILYLYSKKEMEKENIIDDKYIILKKIGRGGTAKVFIVKEKNTNHIYAAKVLKDYENDKKKKTIENMFNKEITILTHLKQTQNSEYIINFIDNGSGEIRRQNRPTSINKYLILEYASKGSLFDYIFYPRIGFPEKYSKLYFRKILIGIQECHKAKVYHRDIKLENILLDENYNPKICDFGYAKFNQKKAIEKVGTLYYAAPEIFSSKPYDSSQIDIFSLGATLFTLVNNSLGFSKATSDDQFYSLIEEENFDKYWEKFEKKGVGIGLSEAFKKLYVSMVAFIPQNRPSIEDILNSEWMKELRELDEEQIKELEKDVKEEFKRREEKIEESKKKNIKGDAKSSLLTCNDSRSGEDEIREYFDKDLKPRCLDEEDITNNCNIIKIKGKLNPAMFMNNLDNSIREFFKDKCDIEERKYKLKFTIIFKNEEENEEDNDEENEDNNEDDEDNENNEDKNTGKIRKKNCNIQVNLFENKNGEYILRFVKEYGELEDYYKNVEIINDLVNKMF